MKFYYFVGKDGLRHGPLPLGDLTSEEISPDTLVFCKGMRSWEKAKSVEDIKGILHSQDDAWSTNADSEKISVQAEKLSPNSVAVFFGDLADRAVVVPEDDPKESAGSNVSAAKSGLLSTADNASSVGDSSAISSKPTGFNSYDEEVIFDTLKTSPPPAADAPSPSNTVQTPEEKAAGTFFGVIKQLERQKQKQNNTNYSLYYLFLVLGFLVIGFAVWFFFFNPKGMQKKIEAPLSANEIEKLAKDNPGFLDIYGYIEEIRNVSLSTSDEATLSMLSYRQMYDFLLHYTDPVYCKQLGQLAKADYSKNYIETNMDEFNELINQWMEYIEEHDPAAYLRVEVGERYEVDNRSYISYYYPGFFFTLSYPNGEISNAKIEAGLWNETTQSWHYNAHNIFELDELKEINKDSHFRWSGVYSSSTDIFGEWHMKADLLSVTLLDGTVISKEDIEQVPYLVRLYIEYPDQEAIPTLIATFVDQNIPSEKKFVSSYISDKLKEENEAAFMLCEKANNQYEVIPRGWSIY